MELLLVEEETTTPRLRPDEALDRLDHARKRRLVERAFERRSSSVCDAVSLIHRAEAAIDGGDVERARASSRPRSGRPDW